MHIVYPGGQQQRVCIARCLAIEPEVILMDETDISIRSNLNIKSRRVGSRTKRKVYNYYGYT